MLDYQIKMANRVKGGTEMVHFTNIVIKDGYIEADVWNESNGVREHIRAKLDGSYHSSSDGDIQKATWV